MALALIDALALRTKRIRDLPLDFATRQRHMALQQWLQLARELTEIVKISRWFPLLVPLTPFGYSRPGLLRCNTTFDRDHMNQISPGIRESEEAEGYFLEDLQPGMTASYARTVTEADVILFAGVSGDQNPVHLNQEFAEGTRFKGRIAHGMLTASFISTVLGNKLPGAGCIYVSQNLKFKAPVRAGDTVRTRVTVLDIDIARSRVRLETLCRVGDATVIEGEAVLMVPRRIALGSAE